MSSWRKVLLGVKVRYGKVENIKDKNMWKINKA